MHHQRNNIQTILILIHPIHNYNWRNVSTIYIYIYIYIYLYIYIYIYIYIYTHTGCPRRKGPNFGRVFLRSNYTDITQNTYIQSSMVTEILAREV